MPKEIKLEKISNVITKYNLKPKKALSQNFLLDLNLTEKIVKSAGTLQDFDVLEIGPGPGTLTRSLLESKVRKVIVIEKDKQFLKPLEDLQKAYPNRLIIMHADALHIDPKPFLTEPTKVISNLPYNVGTKILLNFITDTSWPPFWNSLTFMLQKEVAERLVSKPKRKSYGRLSIISQWRSNVKILFKVSAESFTPTPKVDSALVQFNPIKQQKFLTDQKTLETICKLAFNQRRKMLRQSLKGIHNDFQKILVEIGIDPTSRPEELSVEKFCQLADSIKRAKS